MSEITNPEMVKKALFVVKHHINRQEYEKARVILMRIKHPKQQEWLQRLDASIRRTKASQGAKPWNPGFWAGMTIVASPLITSTILGWNWRRFDKKGWVLPTILFQVLLFAATLGLLFSGFIWSGTETSDTVYSTVWMGALMFLAMINYTFPFFIAGRQTKALKVLEAKGRMAMRAHQYDWAWGMLIWGINIVVILCIVGVIGVFRSGGFQSPPKTYADDQIMLEYPADWYDFDVRYIRVCHYDIIECHMGIQTDFGSAGLAVGIVDPIPGVSTADGVMDIIWDNIPRDDKIERGRYVISGRETKYATAYVRADGRTYYARDFVVVSRGRILVIGTIAENEATMEEYWEEIKAIIDSLVWTP